MTRWLGWMASLLLGAPPMADAVDLSESTDLAAFVDGVMTSYMKNDHIPSAVVAIVQDGRVILASGYGQEDLGEPAPIDPLLSTFRIGSVAKLFTWTAVMQLVEQGKLDLDQDVNTYLKGLQLPQTYDAPVTLRSLMTHTAGFEEGALFYLTALDPKQQSPIQDTLVRHMAVRVRPPLTMPAYSNYGAALAGLIVEQVSGVPFNDYVRRNIFEPLQMGHTTSEEPLPESMREHEVSGYTRSSGDYVRQPFEVIGGWRPAGSASSSAIDMTRFMLAHLQQGEYEGGRILQPPTVERMHTTAFRMDERIAGMALGFYERSVNGLRIVGHAGDTDFFHSDLVLIPERRFGLFISYVSAGGSAIRKGLLKALADRYFPAAAAQLPPPSSDLPLTAEKYAGSYQPSRRNFSDIYKLFNLATQVDVAVDTTGRRLLVGGGDEVQQFVPVGTDLFQQVGGDRRIAFRVGDDGRTTHMFFDGSPYNGMDRTPWHERPGTFLLAIVFCVVTFMVALIKLRPRVLASDGRAPGCVRRAASGTAMLGVLTVLAFVVVVLMNADGAFYSVPLSLKLVLLLPPAFAVATAVLIATTTQAWSRSYWSRSSRLLYTVNCLAAVVLCVLFYQWNVFGWQFG